MGMVMTLVVTVRMVPRRTRAMTIRKRVQEARVMPGVASAWEEAGGGASKSLERSSWRICCGLSFLCSCVVLVCMCGWEGGERGGF